MLEHFKASFLDFFRGPLRRAIFPLLVITTVVLATERMGWFEHLQASTVDAFARGVSRKVSTDVVIVEITDSDYQEFFDAVSPLNPAVVVKLIESVGKLNPLAIGVDLDTQDPTWACAKLGPIQEQMSSIVWAEVPEEAALPTEGRPTPLRLTPVLGGGRSPLQFAITRFPEDVDGVVRKYVDTFLVVDGRPIYSENPQCKPKAGSTDVSIPSPPSPGSKENVAPVVAGMHHALAQLVWEKKKNSSKPLKTVGDRPEYLRFDGNRYDFPIIKASALLTWGPGDRKKGLPLPRSDIDPFDPGLNLLRKKIVLIGGSFRAARDEYMTPVGKMAGVELIAHAIQTESLGALPETPGLALGLDLFLGSVIVFIYYVCSRRPLLALGLSVGTALIVPLLLSAYLFYNVRWFLNFVPIMFGMIVHQMYEGTKLSAEMRKELTTSEKRNAALNNKLHEAQTTITVHGAENQMLRMENGALNAMLQDAQSRIESRDAENEMLRKENAQLETDGEELRAHVRRLGGHVRAKGQHAG